MYINLKERFMQLQGEFDANANLEAARIFDLVHKELLEKVESNVCNDCVAFSYTEDITLTVIRILRPLCEEYGITMILNDYGEYIFGVGNGR